MIWIMTLLIYFLYKNSLYIQELCNLLDIKMPIYKAKIKQNFELQTGYKRLKESYGDKIWIEFFEAAIVESFESGGGKMETKAWGGLAKVAAFVERSLTCPRKTMLPLEILILEHIWWKVIDGRGFVRALTS